jgi:hypothetical protein
MEEYLETLCPNKEMINALAKDFAAKTPAEQIQKAIQHYEEEEADILDMLDQDFHRQIHTEETIMDCAEDLYRVRRILMHLRERLEVDSLMKTFEAMETS